MSKYCFCCGGLRCEGRISGSILRRDAEAVRVEKYFSDGLGIDAAGQTALRELYLERK